MEHGFKNRKLIQRTHLSKQVLWYCITREMFIRFGAPSSNLHVWLSQWNMLQFCTRGNHDKMNLLVPQMPIVALRCLKLPSLQPELWSNQFSLASFSAHMTTFFTQILNTVHTIHSHYQTTLIQQKFFAYVTGDTTNLRSNSRCGLPLEFIK